jgi:hypothetical protein
VNDESLPSIAERIGRLQRRLEAMEGSRLAREIAGQEPREAAETPPESRPEPARDPGVAPDAPTP